MAAAVLVAMNASAGLAADGPCVKPEDVARGLKVRFVSGRWADYRREGDGAFRITESPAKDGHVATFLSQYGLYDTEMTTLSGGQPDPASTVTVGFSDPVADLPVPSPGDVWVGQVTITTPDGKKTVSNAAYQFGTARTLRLGACSYAALDVKLSLMGGDNWIWEEFTYFTDLGIGAIVARQDSGDPGPSRAKVSTIEPLTD